MRMFIFSHTYKPSQPSSSTHPLLLYPFPFLSLSSSIPSPLASEYAASTMSSYLIILTGATGGLGRTIAQTWVTAHGSSKVGSLHLILVGRSMEALTSQKEELLSLKKGLTNDTTGSDLVVSIVANVDLAKIEELDTHWQHIHATYQVNSIIRGSEGRVLYALLVTHTLIPWGMSMCRRDPMISCI